MTTPAADSMTDADLDDALVGVGNELDRIAAAHRTLSSSPMPTTRRRTGRVWLALASIGVVALAGLGIALRSGSDDPPTEPFPPADSAPTATPPTPDERTAMLAACDADLQRFVSGIPAEVAESMPWVPPAVDVAEIAFVPHDDGATFEVIIADGDSGWHCSANRHIEPAPQGGSIRGEMFVNPERPLRADSLVIRSASWSSMTDEGRTGPGDVSFAGQIGDDVTSVTFSLSDGTRYAASIAEGWFFAESEIARGVPLGDDLVEWTLADGSTRAAPTDLLDGLDDLESCAIDDQCFNEALVRLEGELAERPDLYDEGRFDSEALTVEREMWAGCARAEGHAVTVNDDGIQFSSPPSDGPVTSVLFPTEELLEVCDRSLLDAIGELNRLLETRNRLEQFTDAAVRRSLVAEHSEAGVGG